LYQKAIENGCQVLLETVDNIVFENNEFTVTTTAGKSLQTSIVLGAFGKRSNIDINLNRNFIQQKSPWLAIKAHYEGEFPNDVVGLHNFNGGYCGVSKVEDDKINICYLASYQSFKMFKNSIDYQEQIVVQNPYLKDVFIKSKLLFEKPLTISQISFEAKQPVEQHILMIGDTAGLIHPLCGNGMAMAIHSAKIATEVVNDFVNERLTTRESLEETYTKQWNKTFKSRLKTGRILANILLKPKLTDFLCNIIIKVPFMLPFIIKKTHGKPIIIKN
jgi:flavin-dependent dehydrogenase